MRSPVRRSTMMASRAKRSSSWATAAMTAVSMSGGSARGRVSGWRGMSASKINRWPGVSAHPQAVMSSRKARTAIAAWAWT